MSSYLAEVLASCEKMEVEQIKQKCPEVAKRMETSRDEVLSYLENVYVRFIDRPRQNKALANKVNQLQDDISSLIENVEQLTLKDLSTAKDDLEKYLTGLQRATTEISVVSVVYNIHEALLEVADLRRTQSYLECMKKILEIESSINSLDLNLELPAVTELKSVLITEKIAFLNTLSNLFKDNVVLAPGENKSVMKIKNETDEMKDVLPALYFYKTSVTLLDSVTRFLWNHVFVPVVDTTCEIKINAENDFSILEVITVDPNKKSSYVEVFANIKTVLAFLLANFNFVLSEELYTLSYIGRDIRDNLSELIIKHCLQDTIPSTNEGLQKYNVVIEATEDLEKSLVMSNIFATDTVSILEYANNIDVLFINKKCQEHIQTAQELMKKDLHDLVEVGESQSKGLELEEGFPRCSISRSVVELLNLMEKILVQAINSSDVCAGRLFCTVKNICSLYVTFVPEHHKKLLQTIPQQIGLFYNNCNYIAHGLSGWSDTYLKKLPVELDLATASFGDEGSKLRSVASEKFTTYVRTQIKQIEEIMKDSGLQKPTLEQLEPSTEKCVRQCLRQQELLRTVWHKVLPYDVYNKNLGLILDSLCAHLVRTVVKCEDISSDAAEQLVELFKMVQTRAPKLFTDPKEVSLFVAGWYKLNELAFVLNASLVDIDDRWADGKGPLGLQFEGEELRALVRALFQNTERRAALLMKIHD